MITFALRATFALAACVSLFLTVDYMQELSRGTGLVVPFVLMGIVFEVCKLLFPLLAIESYRDREKVKAFLLGIGSLLLILVSLYASFNALTQSNYIAVKNSDKYEITMSQIEAMKSQAQELRKLNRITKAHSVDSKIIELQSELKDIRNNATNSAISPDAIKLVSFLLEFVSLLLAVSLSKKKNVTNINVSSELIDISSNCEISEIIQTNLHKFEDGRIKYRDVEALGVPLNGTAIKQALEVLASKGIVKKDGRHWKVA